MLLHELGPEKVHPKADPRGRAKRVVKMSAVNVNRINAPQAFVSSYAPRIRTYGNSLLTPVQPQLQLPPVRTTKRGTTAINYAEEFDDDSIDDSDGPRRATGLRTAQQRREVHAEVEKAGQKEVGKEVFAPVDVQGIWREWMGKPKKTLTERQAHVQSALPTALVPIRIDLDVAPFRPEAALPTPNNAKDLGSMRICLRIKRRSRRLSID